jgi:hypothetical protein
MYQGPTLATGALETGGNLERIYAELVQTQARLLREMLVELRVHSQILQAGLNTIDEPEALRDDARTDQTLITQE